MKKTAIKLLIWSGRPTLIFSINSKKLKTERIDEVIKNKDQNVITTEQINPKDSSRARITKISDTKHKVKNIKIDLNSMQLSINLSNPDFDTENKKSVDWLKNRTHSEFNPFSISNKWWNGNTKAGKLTWEVINRQCKLTDKNIKTPRFNQEV